MEINEVEHTEAYKRSEQVICHISFLYGFHNAGFFQDYIIIDHDKNFK